MRALFLLSFESFIPLKDLQGVISLQKLCCLLPWFSHLAMCLQVRPCIWIFNNLLGRKVRLIILLLQLFQADIALSSSFWLWAWVTDCSPHSWFSSFALEPLHNAQVSDLLPWQFVTIHFIDAFQKCSNWWFMRDHLPHAMNKDAPRWEPPQALPHWSLMQ